MLVNNKSLRHLLIVALSMLSACGEQGPNSGIEAGSYQIIDSEFGTSDNQVYWLDNERVIFYGYAGPKPMTVEEKSKRDWGIFIWDTISNEVTKYADSSGGLCYSNGYIYYQVSMEMLEKEPETVKKYVWKSGKYGNEVKEEQIWRKSDKKEKDTLWNPLTCQGSERPLSMQGRYWVPLLEGDGYLDGGPGNILHKSESDYAHYIKGDGEEVILPIKINQDYRKVSYSEYRKSYLLQHSSWGRGWIASRCIPVWWLNSAGKIHKECIQINNVDKGILSWLERSTGIGSFAYPTAKGYFLIFGYKSDQWVGCLINGEEAKIVMKGLIKGAAVSPDGCRIAYPYATDWEAVRVGGKGHQTLKMVKVCN